MHNIECHRSRVGLFCKRCSINIYQKFRKKNNVSFKSQSSYWQNNLSKTPDSIFVFLSLLIATYFLLKLIIKDIKLIQLNHKVRQLELKR